MGRRHFLRFVSARPGLAVRGYGEDGRVELDVERTRWFTIGRAGSCDIVIPAMIGGRRTFTVLHHDGRWWFHVANEWAVALIRGRQARLDSPPHCLADGDLVEFLEHPSGEVVHALIYELTDV